MLKDFYVALQTWIDNPGENPCGFCITFGICDNLENWCCSQSFDLGQSNTLNLCLVESFKEAGLHPGYPFNKGSIADFSKETTTFALYKNPARLKWVADHAQTKHP